MGVALFCASVHRRIRTQDSPFLLCSSSRISYHCLSDWVAPCTSRASNASMSSLSMCKRKSLKRWATLEAPCVPKPSRRSETKRRV